MASAKEMYARYIRWCEENGERAERQKAFGIRLAERGFRRVKNSTMVWHSIGLMKETGGTGRYGPKTGLATYEMQAICEPETWSRSSRSSRFFHQRALSKVSVKKRT